MDATSSSSGEAARPDFSVRAALFPHINPEGVKFGLAALAICVALAVLAELFCPYLRFSTGLMCLLVYGVFLFFRDPERYPPENEPDAMLSPADGRVCQVAKRPMPDAFGELEEFKGREYWCVSVFMSVFNVHVNRMPAAGTIEKLQYVAAGKFFNASLDKASKENERCNWLVRTADGGAYAVTQIAGLVARRIVPLASEGAKMERAERFGLIRFGSRLDIYLPEGVEPAVRAGQTMVAGETVVARPARKAE